MAERLAPVSVEAPITSRPERRRGTRWRWPRRIVGSMAVLVVILASTVATAHVLSVERHAQEIRASSLVPLGKPARVLVVIARPGQELAMAGTLVALQAAGTSVALLSLTADPAEASTAPDPAAAATAANPAATTGAAEAGAQSAAPIPPDAQVPPILTSEARTLGLDAVDVAGFSPGELMVVDPAAVIDRISQAIAVDRPSAILTINDATGGDRDSQAVAGYTLVGASQPKAGVARVWTVSRGAWERDWQALAGSTVDQQVPTPQVAVRLLGDIAGVKSAALADYAAHGYEATVSARYPAWNRVPSTMYLRFWDREYFALAWGEPVG